VHLHSGRPVDDGRGQPSRQRDQGAREIKAREPQLDILVNNAGATWGAPIEEFPESAWDKVMDINVKGPFFLTQALLPLLEASASPRDPARIINIGSIDGTWQSATSRPTPSRPDPFRAR
jgi:NAD(P)-dependent dehydrogenase (short-subunit alcohol dehydrogenase family)